VRLGPQHPIQQPTVPPFCKRLGARTTSRRQPRGIGICLNGVHTAGGPPRTGAVNAAWHLPASHLDRTATSQAARVRGSTAVDVPVSGRCFDARDRCRRDRLAQDVDRRMQGMPKIVALGSHALAAIWVRGKDSTRG